MMFFLGKVTGNLWIDDIVIYEGMDSISGGGTLTEKNIKLLGIWEKYTEPNRQRQMDQSEFYIKLQSDYFSEMKSYLKEDIGVQMEMGSHPTIYPFKLRELADARTLKLLGKPERLIQFVQDRPGHDFRYSVNCAKIKKLGWKPKVTFSAGIKQTVEWYLSHLNWMEKQLHLLEAYWKNVYKGIC